MTPVAPLSIPGVEVEVISVPNGKLPVYPVVIENENRTALLYEFNISACPDSDKVEKGVVEAYKEVAHQVLKRFVDNKAITKIIVSIRGPDWSSAFTQIKHRDRIFINGTFGILALIDDNPMLDKGNTLIKG